MTPRQLRKNRRYAIVACAASPPSCPGDAITLLLETVPLYLLYEASILVASLVGRADGASQRDERRARDHEAPGIPRRTRRHQPTNAAEPTVQEIIDHVDRELSD